MPNKTAAFQGELGAFSQVAIQQLLGSSARPVPHQRFEQAFESLANGSVDRAVIPIENTLHGSVHENYDHLLHFDLPIIGETHVRIAHNLIAPPGIAFKDVRHVYSHPVALNQCLRFFAAHPKLERIPFYDTAGSVKMLMEKMPAGSAAIASSMAARIYHAKILKAGIEDESTNFTRFFLLARPADAARQRTKAKEWKTTVVFGVKNIPGALFRCLSAFSLRDLSLAKIESRPLRGRPWEYLFYLDCMGKIGDRRVENALSHLREFADMVRILGSYPAGV